MKKILLLSLSAILMFMAAPAAMAQVVPDDGNPNTLENTCEGIVSQEDYEACAAEQAAAGNPTYTDTDPQVGDTCPEGFAAFGDPGTGQLTCVSPDDPTIAQYSEEASTTEPTEVAASEFYSTLPDTGGPTLLMPVAALLIGAGLLSAAVLRRM